VSNGRSWSRSKVFVTYIPVEVLGDIQPLGLLPCWLL
jgi:hypothetical protein